MGLISPTTMEGIKKGWYKFSKSYLSVIGLASIILIVFLAIFAPYVAPYPEHAEFFVDFPNANKPPSWTYLFGTDIMGRDILSRIFFGFRYSLMMAVVVLSLVVPPGVILGLIAGYYKDTWIEKVIMRVTDVFLGVPPLVLALSICSVLEPNIFNAMMAVSLMWWPWYCRLVYGITSSLRNEFFVQAAEVTGAGTPHILFREILPNCFAAIMTKMTLDVGWVILIGASLSYLGLGAQPPTPDLGTMVAGGAKYLPDLWWISIFPAIAIVFVILGFNMLGDGIRDLFAIEEI